MRLAPVSSSATDPQGVVQFCQLMYPKLVGTLALHCGDRDVAEEMAQETLARVWERWPSVSEMEAPQAWAYRVGFNLAASRFRRRAAERRAHRRLAHPPPTGVGADPAEMLALRQAVAALPDRQRAAILLRYFADLSVADAALALDCRPGTVKSLTSHAIERLRQHFAVTVAEEDPEYA